MRIKLTVSNNGFTEQGVSLIDKEHNSYHWITKSKTSPIVCSPRDVWFDVTATLYKDKLGRNILKNVRIKK